MIARAKALLPKFYRTLPLVIVVIVPLAYYGPSFDPEFPKTLFANSISLWMVVLYGVIPKESRQNLRPGRSLRIGVFLLFFLGVLSLFRAINLTQGLEAYGALVRNGVLCFTCAGLAKKRRWRQVVFSCLAFSSAVVSMIGILQYYGVRPNSVLLGGRWSSTLGNINFAAQFILISAVPCVLWFALTLEGRKKLWALGYFVIVAWYFILCRSRGAWLGGLVGICVAFVFIIYKRRSLGFVLSRRLLWSSLVILVLLVPLSFLPRPGRGVYEPMYRYFLTAFDPSASVTNRIRLGLWKADGQLIRDNRWTGVGLGNLEEVFPLYRSAEERALSGPLSAVDHVHNDFLQMASEGGVIYLFAFLAFLGLIIRRCWTTIRGENRREMIIFAVACLSGIAGTMIHSGVSSNLHRPASSVCFWMLCGIAHGLADKREILTPTANIPSRRLWGLVLLFVPVLWIGQLPGQVHAKRGEILLKQNMIPQAEAEIGRALRILPRSDELLFLEARIDFKQSKFDSCEDHYMQSLTWAPNRDKTHLNLYLCAKSNGDDALAGEALKRAQTLLSEEEVKRLLSR